MIGAASRNNARTRSAARTLLIALLLENRLPCERARLENEHRAMRWPDLRRRIARARMRIFRRFAAATRAGVSGCAWRPEQDQCSNAAARRDYGDKTLCERNLQALHSDGAK